MSRRNKPANRYGCKPEGDVCVEHDLPLVHRLGCAKSTRQRDPVADDVYIKESEGEHRRVIDVRIGRVCYSNGTDLNHWCNVESFREWFKGAKLEHDGLKPA